MRPRSWIDQLLKRPTRCVRAARSTRLRMSRSDRWVVIHVRWGDIVDAVSIERERFVTLRLKPSGVSRATGRIVAAPSGTDAYSFKAPDRGRVGRSEAVAGKMFFPLGGEDAFESFGRQRRRDPEWQARRRAKRADARGERLCLDCGADISVRRPRSKRCEECQSLRTPSSQVQGSPVEGDQMGTAGHSPPPSCGASGNRASTGTSTDSCYGSSDRATGSGSSGCSFTASAGNRDWVPLRLVTLAEAQDAALANRKVARAGGDPRRTRTRILNCRSVPPSPTITARRFKRRTPSTTWRRPGSVAVPSSGGF